MKSFVIQNEILKAKKDLEIKKTWLMSKLNEEHNLN